MNRSALGAVMAIFVGVSCASAALLISTFPPEEANRVTSPIPWALIALMFIAFFEVALRSLRKELTNLGQPMPSNAPPFVLLLVVLTFVAALAAIVYAAVQLFAAGRLGISAAFVAQVLVYGAYLVVRAPLIDRMRHAESRNNMPSYQLMPDGVVFNLDFTDLQEPGRKYAARVRFDEIEDIRPVSFHWAYTFGIDRPGVDAKLLLQGPAGLQEFISGKIPRPPVVNLISSSGTTLFLRGTSLLYLITVRKGDVTDLLNAYQAFKTARALRS